MAISALFASTACAETDAIDALAPDSTAEAAVPSEPAPAPVAVQSSAPEPIEATDVANDAASAATSIASGAVPSSPTPPPAPVATTSTPAPPDAVGEIAARVSKLVEGGVQGSPEAAAEAVAPVLKRASQAGDEVAESTPGRVLSEVAAAGRKAAALGLPDIEDELLPGLDQPAPASSGVPSGSGPGSAREAPALGGSLLTGVPLVARQRTGGLESLLATQMAPSVDETSSTGALGGLRDATASQSPTIAFPGGSDAIRHFNGPSPLDGPGPLPKVPGVAVGGSGASFFFPIAALLALLALAAQAVLRRLRVVPDFPVPTPFVCALERPG